MCILRSIVFILSIAAFSSLKASGNLKLADKISSKEQLSKLKRIHIFFDKASDICRILKRKYRSRGIEVANPHVSNVPFNKVSVYLRLLSVSVQDNYLSFLFCVDRKRGPPIL